jgi:hypothetical protein
VTNFSKISIEKVTFPYIRYCFLTVSTQLCNTIADELTRTADNVVQLYKRLTIDNGGDLSNAALDRDTMLRGLESSVNEAMRTLRLVVAADTNYDDGNDDSVSANEATAKFQELVAGQDQGKVVNMMQQYSELLLNMMQQRMGERNRTIHKNPSMQGLIRM